MGLFCTPEVFWAPDWLCTTCWSDTTPPYTARFACVEYTLKAKISRAIFARSSFHFGWPHLPKCSANNLWEIVARFFSIVTVDRHLVMYRSAALLLVVRGVPLACTSVLSGGMHYVCVRVWRVLCTWVSSWKFNVCDHCMHLLRFIKRMFNAALRGTCRVMVSLLTVGTCYIFLPRIAAECYVSIQWQAGSFRLDEKTVL